MHVHVYSCAQELASLKAVLTDKGDDAGAAGTAVAAATAAAASAAAATATASCAGELAEAREKIADLEAAIAEEKAQFQATAVMDVYILYIYTNICIYIYMHIYTYILYL